MVSQNICIPLSLKKFQACTDSKWTWNCQQGTAGTCSPNTLKLSLTPVPKALDTTARTCSLKRQHFLKVIKISHNCICFLHLGQDYTISNEPIFLSPLKANLLLDVQAWQLQTQVPSRPTRLEKALPRSIKVPGLFQSCNVINADIHGIYTYIQHFPKENCLSLSYV